MALWNVTNLKKKSFFVFCLSYSSLNRLFLLHIFFILLFLFHVRFTSSSFFYLFPFLFFFGWRVLSFLCASASDVWVRNLCQLFYFPCLSEFHVFPLVLSVHLLAYIRPKIIYCHNSFGRQFFFRLVFIFIFLFKLANSIAKAYDLHVHFVYIDVKLRFNRRSG